MQLHFRILVDYLLSKLQNCWSWFVTICPILLTQTVLLKGTMPFAVEIWIRLYPNSFFWCLRIKMCHNTNCNYLAMHVALPLICSFLHAFEQVMPLMTHISRGFVVVTYKRVILIIIMILWGKAMANYPKNLPRMQCARAIPVTWLGSGSCQPGLWGWILMMMNEWFYNYKHWLLIEWMISHLK